MKKLTTPGKKKLVISALEDIKARDIQAIDVRKMTPIFDWIIVASADSARQTKSLARHVHDKLREAGSVIIGTEGEEAGEWVLVDAGDVVAHVMQPAVRSLYNLEELWGEGKFDRPVNSTVPVPVKRSAPKKPAARKAVAKLPAARKKPLAKKPAATKKPPAKKKHAARKAA
jgi:ribosome-associated protein